jgi:hypothetical protein
MNWHRPRLEPPGASKERAPKEKPVDHFQASQARRTRRGQEDFCCRNMELNLTTGATEPASFVDCPCSNFPRPQKHSKPLVASRGTARSRVDRCADSVVSSSSSILDPRSSILDPRGSKSIKLISQTMEVWQLEETDSVKTTFRKIKATTW